MKNRDSCEKLIGIEAGLPWPEQAKDLPIVTALRREKTVARCMNLLYVFLTIIVLLLVVLYFWHPVTKPTSTQITIENFEIEKAKLLVPMDSNDVASGTSEVIVDDTKTKTSSPDQSVPLREKGIEDWTEDDSHPKSIVISDDDVTKVITAPVVKTSDASDEDNNLPKKWESSSDSNESTRNSSLLPDESFKVENDETLEKLDAYDDRNSEVSNSIEKKNNDEETQKSKNSDESTDYEPVDSEYESYYNNYDENSQEENYEYGESSSEEILPSVEESEEAPIMNELDVKVPIILFSIPTTVGLTIDESDELPTPLNDRESLHDISTQQLSESDSTLNTDQDTNEPDEAEKIVNESTTQDYDPPRPVDDSIDESSHKWNADIITDSDEYDYGNHGMFSAEDYSNYFDWKDETDWGLRMKFENLHQEDSDYWWPMNIFSDNKSFFGGAIDEQNKEETTEDGRIREAKEMVTIENPSLSDSKIDSSSQSSTEFISEGNTEKNDTVSTSSPEKNVSEDALSEESDTVESHSIPNDTEDSQQVNEDTVNLEPTSKSVEDSDSSNMDWIDSALLPYYCEILKDMFPKDVILESDIPLGFPQGGEMGDELNVIFTDLWMNKCSLSKGKYLDKFREHFISKRSLTERVSDSPSVSKAGEILTAMQQVIKQDRNYIHDAVSRIHGSMAPVVESQVNEFFEKMETVSSHIDRLHEQYLKNNKLEDDYVSREFPSEP